MLSTWKWCEDLPSPLFLERTIVVFFHQGGYQPSLCSHHDGLRYLRPMARLGFVRAAREDVLSSLVLLALWLVNSLVHSCFELWLLWCDEGIVLLPRKLRNDNFVISIVVALYLTVRLALFSAELAVDGVPQTPKRERHPSTTSPKKFLMLESLKWKRRKEKKWKQLCNKSQSWHIVLRALDDVCWRNTNGRRAPVVHFWELSFTVSSLDENSPSIYL